MEFYYRVIGVRVMIHAPGYSFSPLKNIDQVLVGYYCLLGSG
jgi:hypothetical protein